MTISTPSTSSPRVRSRCLARQAVAGEEIAARRGAEGEQPPEADGIGGGHEGAKRLASLTRERGGQEGPAQSTGPLARGGEERGRDGGQQAPALGAGRPQSRQPAH